MKSNHTKTVQQGSDAFEAAVQEFLTAPMEIIDAYLDETDEGAKYSTFKTLLEVNQKAIETVIVEAFINARADVDSLLFDTRERLVVPCKLSSEIEAHIANRENRKRPSSAGSRIRPLTAK